MAQPGVLPTQKKPTRASKEFSAAIVGQNEARAAAERRELMQLAFEQQEQMQARAPPPPLRARARRSPSLPTQHDQAARARRKRKRRRRARQTVSRTASCPITGTT